MPGRSPLRRIGALALVLLVLTACAPARGSSPAGGPAASPTGSPAQSAPAQSAPARAPDAPATADFYRGKTVRIVVAFPAGGGFDIVGRLVAKYIGKFTPGNPTVIVENMPGAASMLAASSIYNLAPKDGTVIGVVNGGATVVEQLFGASGVQYDAARMQYLGAPYVFSYVLLAAKAADVPRFTDVVGPNAKQLLVGATNPGSTTYDAPILLHDISGANLKVVSGYDGTAPILLAIDRGEVQAIFNPWESLKPTVYDRVQSGDYLILGQFTEQPLKDLPNVPEFLKLASTDEQRQLLRLGIIVPARFAVQYFVAPGVPADRVQALETAFAQTMADQEFRADAARVHVEIDPLTGAQLRQLVMDYLSMPADVKARLQKVLRP
jgi:tripartite-type tricarboxylate transporter receptor subunit TctC